MMIPTRALAGATIVLALLLLAACDDDPAGPYLGDPTGTYELVLFNGKTLPAVQVTPSDPCEVVTMEAGTLVLEAVEFTMTQTFEWVGDCGAEPERGTMHLAGTYTLEDGDIALDLGHDWFDFTGTVTATQVVLNPVIPETDQDSERFISYTFRR